MYFRDLEYLQYGDMYYSTNGLKWTKIENYMDVTAMHHNVLSEF